MGSVETGQSRRTACVSALALVLFCSLGCVTAPDGRRALAPGSRSFGAAQLEHVLRCGLPAIASALASGAPPDYLAASECHLDLIGEQLGRALETAPEPDEQHGRDVVRATRLQVEGERAAAKRVARSCTENARIRWTGGGER